MRIPGLRWHRSQDGVSASLGLEKREDPGSLLLVQAASMARSRRPAQPAVERSRIQMGQNSAEKMRHLRLDRVRDRYRRQKSLHRVWKAGRRKQRAGNGEQGTENRKTSARAAHHRPAQAEESEEPRMTPEQIRAEATATANQCAEHERTECPDGTSGIVVLLGEIAAQLAEMNQKLDRPSFRTRPAVVYVKSQRNGAPVVRG